MAKHLILIEHKTWWFKRITGPEQKPGAEVLSQSASRGTLARIAQENEAQPRLYPWSWIDRAVPCWRSKRAPHGHFRESRISFRSVPFLPLRPSVQTSSSFFVPTAALSHDDPCGRRSQAVKYGRVRGNESSGGSTWTPGQPASRNSLGAGPFRFECLGPNLCSVLVFFLFSGCRSRIKVRLTDLIL